MRIWKNLFGKNDKLHSDEIVVGEQGNRSLLTDALNSKVEVILQGNASGKVIDRFLIGYGTIYLLIVGRDGGFYLISHAEGETFVHPIREMHGIGSVTGSNQYLTVDFSDRGRPYVLLKLR